jgi:hypothetical protein
MAGLCVVIIYCAVLAGIRGKIEMFNFSAATLERAGLPSSAATNIPPFVVIASNDINQVGVHPSASAAAAQSGGSCDGSCPIRMSLC